MIYAEPDVYMRMLHMFLEGYPEYDTDFPNEFDANLENNIPKYLKITCYDSVICLHDDERVLACKAHKVVFIYQTSHINSVKLDMYRVLKEFLFMQVQKLNQNQVDILHIQNNSPVHGTESNMLSGVDTSLLDDIKIATHDFHRHDNTINLHSINEEN